MLSSLFKKLQQQELVKYTFLHIPKLLFFCCILTLTVSCQSKSTPLFSLLSPSKTGVHFKNILEETEDFNVLNYGYLYNGGGVAIGDINNDSLPDIYFTGNMVGSRLYLNQGDFKFKEIAETAGVFAAGLWNTGTTMADVNADGLLDIYVCRSAAVDSNKRKNLLFINNGDLSFTEKGAEYGVNDPGYSTQAAFFDFDNDGDLDLYILNHSTQQYSGLGKIAAHNKKKFNPYYADKLLRNDNGKFVDISTEAGILRNVLGFGLGIAVSDINNDNYLDLYISNDYSEQDYLYINNGNGTFKEQLKEFMGHVPLYSMGSDIADINNDGYSDIMTLDMLPEGNRRIKMVLGPDNFEKFEELKKNGFYNQSMRNMLQLNQGGDYFSEVGQFAGVSNTDWSWAALFTDFDNDGLKDLFITNGYKRDYTNMDFMNYVVQEKIKENQSDHKIVLTALIKKMPATVEENYTYKNNGNVTFTKMNSAWGMDQKTLSNGAAYGDLDNDGDIDLVINNIDEKAFIYRNNTERFLKNHYLKIQLKGLGGNTFGIGAKVTLKIGDQQQTQELVPTRGYQSSVDYTLNFGIGKHTVIDEVIVLWPNFKSQRLTNVAADQRLVLEQKNAQTIFQPQDQKEKMTYFKNVTTQQGMNHTHKENIYVDFKRQLLLPHMLSTQGPKLATADINGDTFEDIFIGGAKGTAPAIYIQNENGKFIFSPQDAFNLDATSEDLGATFFDADNDGDLDLYVVSGGNEFEPNAVALSDRLYLNNGNGIFKKTTDRIPEFKTSGSCVRAADFDEDGDMDLFVGGRLIPTQYPLPPKSYLLENDGHGYFKDITPTIAPDLTSIGMVTDALWADINNDQLIDLILVGEWMPITIFLNRSTHFENSTEHYGLQNTQGWWNTVAAADVDKDGDLDFLLGNFGCNGQLKTNALQPVNIYAKDFDNNGTIDPILCSYYKGRNYPVFSKDDIQEQLSMLKNRFVRYETYADSKITDVFSKEELADALHLEAKIFSSSYLENIEWKSFKLHPLPDPVQYAPIYAINTGDYNNDGNTDVVLGGNFTATRVKFGSFDALKGVFLTGDGNGNFNNIPSKNSGLKVNGEIRDIKQIKTGDNKNLLIFAINNAAVQIFKTDGK